jgi:prepilin signal peptidase PulO-like enzyme (type II secretory pathway)
MITAFFVFVFGACIGSFCSAWLYRARSGDSIVTGRSECTSCHKRLAAIDLIPIVSQLICRSRCRYCKAKFSWSYMALEVGMGALFLGAYYRYCGFGFMCSASGQNFFMAMRLAFFLVFLALVFIYDARYGEIPDAFSITGGLVALTVNIFMKPNDWMWYLLAAAVGAAFFGAQYVLSRGKWVGDGDILLGAMIGAMVGWPFVIVSIFSSYILGLIVVFSLMILKRKKLDDTIPMGPLLALGAAAVLILPLSFFPFFWYAW